MPELPRGTVTFLFTDIEGSTRLLQGLGQRYPKLLAKHNELLRRLCREARGAEFGSEGDALFFAFGRATDALSASVVAQRAIAAYHWPGGTRFVFAWAFTPASPTLLKQAAARSLLMSQVRSATSPGRTSSGLAHRRG